MSDTGQRGFNEAARQLVRQNAGSSLLEAAVMLFIGLFYYHSGLQGVSDSEVYNHSVTVAVWTFLMGGLVLLWIAGLSWLGWRRAPLCDAAASLGIGVVLLGTGGIWLANSDMMGLLLVLFGAISLHAARGSWRNHQMVQAVRRGAFAPGQVMGGFAEAPPQPSTMREAVESAAEGETLRQLLDRKKGAVEEQPTRDAGRPESPVPPARSAERRPGPNAPEAPEQLGRVDLGGEPPDEGFLADFGRDRDETG